MQLLVLALLACLMLGLLEGCEGRYLPTRGDDTRLEEIRAMLRELLDGSAEGRNAPPAFDKRFVFKRAAEAMDPRTAALQ